MNSKIEDIFLNINIKSYYRENGICISKYYNQELQVNNQGIIFIVMERNFHNELSDNAIKHTVCISHTIIIHDTL